MSKTAIVQARIEPKLKIKADTIIRKLGLNASQVVNALYAQIVMNNGVPFELKIPNKLTQKTLENSKKGKKLKRFSNMKELIKDLDE